jgi:hypothetical protein
VLYSIHLLVILECDALLPQISFCLLDFLKKKNKKKITTIDYDNNNRSNMLSYCSILDIINTLNVTEFGYWHKKLYLQLSNNLTVLTRLPLFCVMTHTFIFSPYDLFMLLILEIKW